MIIKIIEYILMAGGFVFLLILICMAFDKIYMEITDKYKAYYKGYKDGRDSILKCKDCVEWNTCKKLKNKEYRDGKTN